MRTILFFGLLIAIIGTGFFLKGKGLFKPAGTQEQVNTPTNKLSYQSADQDPSGKNTAPAPEEDNSIVPISNWPEILHGEWKLQEFAKNERQLWKIEGEIEFLKDSTFNLYITANYYDLTYYVTSNEKRLPKITLGGHTKGEWVIAEKYILLSGLSGCDMPTTNIESGYRDKNFDACAYFEGKKFGIIKDNEKTRIEAFNNSRILITGKRYDTGENITYLFERK